MTSGCLLAMFQRGPPCLANAAGTMIAVSAGNSTPLAPAPKALRVEAGDGALSVVQAMQSGDSETYADRHIDALIEMHRAAVGNLTAPASACACRTARPSQPTGDYGVH